MWGYYATEALAEETAEARKQGEALGLTDNEISFYDALEFSDSAARVLGDETIRTMTVNSSKP